MLVHVHTEYAKLCMYNIICTLSELERLLIIIQTKKITVVTLEYESLTHWQGRQPYHFQVFPCLILHLHCIHWRDWLIDQNEWFDQRFSDRGLSPIHDARRFDEADCSRGHNYIFGPGRGWFFHRREKDVLYIHSLKQREPKNIIFIFLSMCIRADHLLVSDPSFIFPQMILCVRALKEKPMKLLFSWRWYYWSTTFFH